MRPLSCQARPVWHHEMTDEPRGFLALPPELRHKVVDFLLLHDESARDDGERRVRLLAGLRASCSSFAYDPYVNSVFFETVPLSCRPSVLCLLSSFDLSHVTPHVRHVEFCQTSLDWRVVRRACQPASTKASTKLGRIINGRRRSNAFYKCIHDIDARPCFSSQPSALGAWVRFMRQTPGLDRISFRYCSSKGEFSGVVPRRAISWMERHLHSEQRESFCAKWYIHITQVFFATVVASLLHVRPAVQELSVQHTLYPTFRWEQIPGWQELDFSRLRRLHYSSFSSTWLNSDRAPFLPIGGSDRLDILENFTSILRQCCHSLEVLTVDAMWYSAADPNEYVVLPWPSDYSLSFPRLTDLRLRRVRLRWKQAARYLERMPALQLLSCRDTCTINPKAGKALWDAIRQRERKPRIETGYLNSSRVIFDPEFDEMPDKYIFNDRENKWEVQRRAQLWTYLAGTGRWTPLLEEGSQLYSLFENGPPIRP